MVWRQACVHHNKLSSGKWTAIFCQWNNTKNEERFTTIIFPGKCQDKSMEITVVKHERKTNTHIFQKVLHLDISPRVGISDYVILFSKWKHCINNHPLFLFLSLVQSAIDLSYLSVPSRICLYYQSMVHVDKTLQKLDPTVHKAIFWGSYFTTA